MKLTVDKDADALFLWLSDSSIVVIQQVSPTVVHDYDGSNEVVGNMKKLRKSPDVCEAT